MPLPDRLCERMKASDWNTRYEAVSELESFVDAYPTALGPHLRKVGLELHVAVTSFQPLSLLVWMFICLERRPSPHT